MSRPNGLAKLAFQVVGGCSSASRLIDDAQQNQLPVLQGLQTELRAGTHKGGLQLRFIENARKCLR